MLLFVLCILSSGFYSYIFLFIYLGRIPNKTYRSRAKGQIIYFYKVVLCQDKELPQDQINNTTKILKKFI